MARSLADRAKFERFRDAIAEHDLATGDKGGGVAKASRAAGILPESGSRMLRNMRRDLGEQAR